MSKEKLSKWLDECVEVSEVYLSIAASVTRAHAERELLVALTRKYFKRAFEFDSRSRGQKLRREFAKMNQKGACNES